MKKSPLWYALVALSVAALGWPSFTEAQTAGTSNPFTNDAPADTEAKAGTTRTPNSSSNAGTSENATRDHGVTEADQDLNARIREAFNADTSLSESTRQVRVSTDNGVVTLYGAVATEKERQDIKTRVQQMAGVTEVRNQLQIAPRPATSSSSTSGSR